MVRGFTFSVERFWEENATVERGLWSYRVKRARIAPRKGFAMGDFASMGAGSMVFVFLSVGAIALFSMISVAVWSGARQKEREAYYKNDMLKRIAEAQGSGAATALELMREEARLNTLRVRQGLQIGGLVTGAAGLGVLIFLRFLLGPDEGVYLCGLIPLFIGMALFTSSYLVKAGGE